MANIKTVDIDALKESLLKEISDRSIHTVWAHNGKSVFLKAVGTRELEKIVSYCLSDEHLPVADGISSEGDPKYSREDILSICKFDNTPSAETGHKLSYDEFTSYIDKELISNLHGEAELVLGGRRVKNVNVWNAYRQIEFDDSDFFISFADLYETFGDDVEFIWHGAIRKE